MVLCCITLRKQINTTVGLMICGHNVFAGFMSFPQLSSESLLDETELWMNSGVRMFHLTSDLVHISQVTLLFLISAIYNKYT